MKMTREIKKHNLDFDKTIGYFIDHIECGKTLSQKIVERTPFKQGTFYTFLPSNAVLSRLYDFSNGGIIPPVPYGTCTYKIEGVSEYFHPQQIKTMDRECSEIISAYTKIKKQNYAVAENYMLEPDNPLVYLENVLMIPFQKEAYYFLGEQNSPEEVYEAIRKSKEVWHTLILLTQLYNPSPKHFDKVLLEEICENTKFIIAGAYDGEGYIFWEKLETEESLHPDFNNPGHKPHWDYVDPAGKEYRLNTDGTWEPK